MNKSNLLPSLGEGFKLIVSEPLSVLAWGLVNAVAVLVPAGVYWTLAGPQMMEFYGAMAAGAGSGSSAMPTPPTMSGTVGLVQFLQYVGTFVAAAFVYGGIYRAVMRPAEGGLGHMRFSADEFNLGVVYVVLAILLFVVSVAVAIAVFIPIGIATALAATGGAGAAIVILVPIVIVALLFGMLLLFSRFGMALPMTFAERRIRIFESWAFTKGYGGQLFAMALLQVLIFIGFYIAAALVVFAAAAGAFINLDGASVESLFNGEEVWRRFIPAIVVGGILYILVLFVGYPILAAPWAKAYQLIARDRGVDQLSVFS